MARKKNLLEGSVEEQLRQVDKILGSIIKRSRGNMAVVRMPPIPVMSCHYNKETGQLINAVIPAAGIVTSIAMFVEFKAGVKSVKCEASLKGPKTSVNTVFTLSHSLTMDDIDVEVEAGSMFSVRVMTPEDIEDASVSALYVIHQDKATVFRHLLEEPV